MICSLIIFCEISGNRQKWVPLPLDPKGNEGENLNSEDNQYSRRSSSWRGGERSRGKRGAGGIYGGERGRRGGGRGRKLVKMLV